MKKLGLAGLIALMLCVAGCGTPTAERKAAHEALVERVRAKVWACALEVSTAEGEATTAEPPKESLYRMAGDYAQYSFEWAVDGARVIVAGTGRLSDLEGSEVRKVTGEKRQKP